MASNNQTILDLAARRNELIANAEATLALELGRFAYEMRHKHLGNTPQLRPWHGLAKRDTRRRARIRAFFGHVASSGPDQAIAQLTPKHPQYEALVGARKRYASIVANGGWGEITATRMNKIRKGRSHPTIGAIKKRLAIEGYDVGTVDDIYDDALIDAVKAYESTHQFKIKGEIDRALIENLNMPAEDRLAKIDVTLGRMRASLVGAFNQYVLVNIPDFHAEVWRHGERHMRFGIVVGNNQILRDLETNEIVYDKKTKQPIRPNRTPLQTAFMRYVIYNPYWNVPKRIRDEELDPKLVENPNWYEENGYEVMYPDNPSASYVRQVPGPDNTLGRVKFIFPNPYDVYLHDTSSKSLFRNPIRAASHGCMRVSTPMEFAEHLLKEDGQWDERWVRSILTTEPYKETTITLRDPVPVHAEYFNTRVDEQGHVAFLSDIYRYDAPKIKKRLAQISRAALKEEQSADANP